MSGLLDNCKTCRFWNFEKEFPTLGRLIADNQMCDCRIHAPVVGAMGATWPKTRGDDGCGDHKFVPDLTPCWLCGEPIGPPPRHYVHYTSEPTCKACAEKEDRKHNQAIMPSHLADQISRKKLYPGAKCLHCGKPYDGEADWLHLEAPGDIHHYCRSCRPDKVP